jgi:hypothetical protein
MAKISSLRLVPWGGGGVTLVPGVLAPAPQVLPPTLVDMEERDCLHHRPPLGPVCGSEVSPPDWSV